MNNLQLALSHQLTIRFAWIPKDTSTWNLNQKRAKKSAFKMAEKKKTEIGSVRVSRTTLIKPLLLTSRIMLVPTDFTRAIKNRISASPPSQFSSAPKCISFCSFCSLAASLIRHRSFFSHLARISISLRLLASLISRSFCAPRCLIFRVAFSRWQTFFFFGPTFCSLRCVVRKCLGWALMMIIDDISLLKIWAWDFVDYTWKLDCVGHKKSKMNDEDLTNPILVVFFLFVFNLELKKLFFFSNENQRKNRLCFWYQNNEISIKIVSEVSFLLVF